MKTCGRFFVTTPVWFIRLSSPHTSSNRCLLWVAQFFLSQWLFINREWCLCTRRKLPDASANGKLGPRQHLVWNQTTSTEAERVKNASETKKAVRGCRSGTLCFLSPHPLRNTPAGSTFLMLLSLPRDRNREEGTFGRRVQHLRGDEVRELTERRIKRWCRGWRRGGAVAWRRKRKFRESRQD